MARLDDDSSLHDIIEAIRESHERGPQRVILVRRAAVEDLGDGWHRAAIPASVTAGLKPGETVHLEVEMPA